MKIFSFNAHILKFKLFWTATLLVSLNLLITSLTLADEIVLDPESSAVTYKITGRLGNNILGYIHAKWISYKYNIPLVFKKFRYSHRFKFHDIETFKYYEYAPKFKNKICLRKLSQMDNLPPSTLVDVPFFRDEGPDAGKKTPMIFQIDWSDPEFRALVKKLLQPREPTRTIKVPEDKFKVLVHVRAGGGYDKRPMQLRFPYKFPPHQFYISSIEQISQYMDNIKMYVYIMTDHLQPKLLADKFKKALEHLPNVEIHYRKNGASGPSSNVIHDFFSISKFNALIRADSTFTITGGMLGNFLIIMTPKKSHVENGEIVVDEVDFQFSLDHKLPNSVFQEKI